MKRSLIFLLLSINLFFASCTKKNAEEKINKDKVEEVLGAESGSNEVYFNMLTPAEKAAAWEYHINDYIQNASLTNEEEDMLDEALAIIEAGLYDSATKDSYAGVMADFQYRARNLFSNNKYVDIFEYLGRSAPIGIGGGTIDPNPAGSCYCRTNWYCERRTGSDLNTCTNTYCSETSSGCGLFGWSACTGRCTPTDPGS